VTPKAGTTVALVAPPAPLAGQEAAQSAAGEVTTAAQGAQTQTVAGLSSLAYSGGGASSGGGGGGGGTAAGGSDAGSSSGSAASAADESPPPHQPDPEKKGWIEVVLKDEEGVPQGGTRYRVTLPDGSVADGTLDAQGKARVEGFDPGSCRVTFPELDQKVWKAK
jgi:hypothetical protein